MLTAEKIQKVKQQLRSGYPEGELKNELRNEGYTEDEITKLFAPRPADMRSWYLAFGIIISLAGLCRWQAGHGFILIIFGGILLSLYYNEEQKRKKYTREK